MKIIAAVEEDGRVIATVRFDDGMDQTVILGRAVSRQAIKVEAARLRKNAEDRSRPRPDLVD